MKTDDYLQHTLEVAGWSLRISSYRVGHEWHAIADNVSPGAWFARAIADTRDEAERLAIERARERLGQTTQTPV
jgi:hypothetical protein